MNGNVSLIAAMARNRVIGCKGRVPWDLPLDLRRFRELTWGHPIIMGRKTFQSIGRALPGRRNIVLSRQAGFHPEGCTVAHSLAEALAMAAGEDEIFVCGGAEVYREAMPSARRIYLTLVHADVAGDVLFPEIPAAFVEKERREVSDNLPCEFILYENSAG